MKLTSSILTRGHRTSHSFCILHCAFCIVMSAMVTSAKADVTIADITARQRWPWNGLVDVDYEIDGHDSLISGLKVQIVFKEQGGEGRSWTAKTFLSGAEPSATRGRHRATWDMQADNATNIVARVVATVNLVKD